MDFTARIDILIAINNGRTFTDIMNVTDPKKKGFIFETIAIICLLVKQLIPDYIEISDTNISDTPLIFKPIKSIKELLTKSINDGNNESDLSVNINKIWTPFSIKHGKTKRKTDLVECEKYMINYSKQNKCNYSLGLICDKDFLTKHRKVGRAENQVIDIAIKDKHFFEIEDITKAFDNFQKILMGKNFTDKEDVIDWIDKEYLNTSGRQHLKLKFNQFMALRQFIRNKNNSLIHCLNHKPRSGKTITMLLYAKYLLENGNKRILIMTSVPETIDNFKEELDKYYEFKNINYKLQKKFMDVDEDYIGIVFCSVQYLKTGNNKDKKEKQLLKQKTEKLKLFDCNMFDECHFHSSNKNTYEKIINVHGDETIMKIFASGTSGKTEWFYNIDKNFIYKWSVEDEAFMKKQFPIQ